MPRNRGLFGVVALLLLLGAAAADARPTPSPRQGSIVLSRADERGRYSLWTVAPGTGRLRRVTRGCGWDWFPAWSPDGRRIAFASDRNGDYEVYVMNADGSGEHRLTTAIGEDSPRAWR